MNPDFRRHDGEAKVTGRAIFAGEEKPVGTLHGVLVPSSIARGRILEVGDGAALAVPGVVRVITARDLPSLGAPPVPPVAQTFVPLTDDTVRYEGQPVALVVAERLEAAERGAELVTVRYDVEEPRAFDLDAAEVPPGQADGNGYSLGPNDTELGDFDAGWAGAAANVDATYETATRHHNMMEPSTTVAEWRGGELHLHDSTQWTYGVRYGLSALLGMDPGKIHVRCPYTGGGFGAKGYVWPHQILAPLAARLLKRPVAVSLGRVGCYTGTGYQPRVHSRVRLAASESGRLRAIHHGSVSLTSTFDDYVEFATAGTRGMYRSPAIRTRTRVARAHVATPTAMRAPHEGPGMFALESAMDELAHALDMDPVELRLSNDAEVDPLHGTPFSSKELAQVYREAARRFGWA
ncbi:MAG: molybdopterin cofactor-binding domain-containing protein, partial [Acidobacteriota bacterium]